MSIQPALPDNTTSIDAIDYRKQEIAIELRNVYHTYDNKFSNLLLRNKTERHVPTTAISSAVKYSKHSSSLSSSEPTSANLNRAADSNNNPFFANVQTSSPFHPFNSETEPHTLFPSTPPVHNALPISGQSNGSMVRFENLPPKLHIAESAFDGSSMVAPPTPGVQATPSLELPPGIRHSSKLILNNCNVTIPRGCIYGLLGPSGCGKTTLLKCITGFLKPTYGRVRVFSSIPWSGVGKIPGPDLGYMPQDYSLHEDLTIAEMLTYFGRIFQLPSNVIQKRIPELIDLLNLPNKNQLIGNLSGGQKRRASFVCSIIHMPQ